MARPLLLPRMGRSLNEKWRPKRTATSIFQKLVTENNMQGRSLIVKTCAPKRIPVLHIHSMRQQISAKFIQVLANILQRKGRSVV